MNRSGEHAESNAMASFGDSMLTDDGDLGDELDDDLAVIIGGEDEGIAQVSDTEGQITDAMVSGALIRHDEGYHPGRRLTPGVNELLVLTEHGLVGGAYARRVQCADATNFQIEMEVGLRDMQQTKGLFCTDDSQTGDMFIGIYAEAAVNNVTMPPRHWYTLSIRHEFFDDSPLASGVTRPGCLAYGQWREYRIVTTGARDATLDASIDVPVSAMYVRRDLPPTESSYDALASWPLQRVSLSGCDVGAPTVWYIAVRLAEQSIAYGRSPPLLQQRFELTANLRAANVSLMQLPPSTRVTLPHNYLCCGVNMDFIVEDVTRSLALRVEVIVHSGYLEAIYLKHQACARYPGDIGPDEQCIGSCKMQWLTTYNPYTLAPTYTTDASVNVPMGIQYADKRAEGTWYISVAAADTVANFSLVAELIESPVIDRFIPLDGDAAAAERCGRFCVIMTVVENSNEDEDELFGLDSAAAPSARMRQWGTSILAVAIATVCVFAIERTSCRWQAGTA